MPLDRWLLFCVACAVLVATPGPNVLYLVSRTVAQGRVAGFISLAGTSCGSGLHVLAAALGLSALLVAVPIAYEAVRWGGAAYLAWLAALTWRSPGATLERDLPPTPRTRLWREGFLTGVLNPKVAVFELALFPQFVVPARGAVLAQSLLLGATQIVIALAGDSAYVLVAAWTRRWFTGSHRFAGVSRRSLATVFALLAVRMVWDDR